MKQLNTTLPVRSITRSDGSVKVYGHTTDGELLTVVMVKNDSGYYDTVEVKIAGQVVPFGKE